MKEVECIVSGFVQMVMYRDFARRKARQLGIVGTVENLSDGTVRVLARGEKKALEEFIKKLWKGPLLANVKDVQVSEKKQFNNYSDFDILY